MSFLNAPYVKRSIEEMEFLRQRLLKQTDIVLNGKVAEQDAALEYLHTLYALADKEHTLYTRLRLSDDVEALVAASQLDGAKAAAETSRFANGDQFYRSLKDDIKRALRILDDTDIDEPYEEW